MKLILSLSLIILGFSNIYSQERNFIDMPYIEVRGNADTLITPDRIYLDILISEEDTKGKTSVEELERKMISALKKLDINLEKQLFVADASSNFKSYFLSGQKVLKSKQYTLLVYKASTLGNVLENLQKIDISNVKLNKTEHSQMESLKTSMKAKAVINAKENAQAMTNAIDQNLGKAIFISENNSFPYSIRGDSASVRIRGNSSMQEETAPDLSFNQIEIKSEVLVRFALN